MPDQICAVADVRWEIPFALMIPAKLLWCWEPNFDVALLQSSIRVGSLTWRRRCSFADAKQIFPASDVDSEPSLALSAHDYMHTALSQAKEELPITRITGGTDGTIEEARAYSVVHLYLCLSQTDDESRSKALKRASDALNNVLGQYAFITGDVLVNRREWHEVAYMTLVSVADVPDGWDQIPSVILGRIGELSFSAEIGNGRTVHQILGSGRDLLQLPLALDKIELLQRLIRRQRMPELYHSLLLSSIRRLVRREAALAVVDAQSAVEVVVAKTLSALFVHGGDSLTVAAGKVRSLPSLEHRLTRLDKLALARAVPRFAGSEVEKRWRSTLYDLRHRIVHEGERTIEFDAARLAVSAGVAAVLQLEGMFPGLRPELSWNQSVANLPQLAGPAGRALGIFEM